MKVSPGHLQLLCFKPSVPRAYCRCSFGLLNSQLMDRPLTKLNEPNDDERRLHITSTCSRLFPFLSSAIFFSRRCRHRTWLCQHLLQRRQRGEPINHKYQLPATATPCVNINITLWLYITATATAKSSAVCAFFFFFLKFVGWFCQGHPDARWASTWVRSRLKGSIAAAPRSSIVIYMITWGWSHSGAEGWEAAPWSVVSKLVCRPLTSSP
jgi:hypothetical protein